MLRSGVTGALFGFNANNVLIGVASEGEFLRRDELERKHEICHEKAAHTG
jgi:hypothetical protein